MPGTTICGLADGNNWAIRTIMNKYRDEFAREALVRAGEHDGGASAKG